MRYESRSRRASPVVDGRTTPSDVDFWVSTEHEGNGFVLSAYGELDVATGPALEKQIKRLQWAGAASITIDLSGLDFIDSCGLHVLIRAHRRGEAGQLKLLRGSKRIHRVFELTGTDERLPFAD